MSEPPEIEGLRTPRACSPKRMMSPVNLPISSEISSEIPHLPTKSSLRSPRTPKPYVENAVPVERETAPTVPLEIIHTANQYAKDGNIDINVPDLAPTTHNPQNQPSAPPDLTVDGYNILAHPAKVSPSNNFHEEPPISAPLGQPLGVLFDDGDDKLPPPQASPTFRAIADSEPLEMSSPELESQHISQNLSEFDLSREDYQYEEQYPQREQQYPPEQFPEHRQEEHIDGQLQDEQQLHEFLPLAFPDVAPSSGQYEEYPAPVPTTLFQPPKLSRRRQDKRRSRTLSINRFPEAPRWGYDEEPGRADSDAESDRATIMSSDGDEFTDRLPPAVEDVEQPQKSKKWFSRMFGKKSKSILDETGEEYDPIEHETLRQQMAVLDNDVAFTRLDPETVQRHSQMFDAGGLHDSITPRRAGTSLIEELEIRKAGRKVQQRVFLREVAEIERQRAEDLAAAHNGIHPADVGITPTLMQMQRMADVDYQSRVEWHIRTVNKNYIQEHGDETLAQRRQRLRQQQSGQQEETLAQRRQRLRGHT